MSPYIQSEWTIQFVQNHYMCERGTMRVYVDLEAQMGESLEIHECLQGEEFQIFSQIVGGIPPIFLLPLVVEVYVYVTHTAIIR